MIKPSRTRPNLSWTYETTSHNHITADFTAEYRRYGPRFAELLDAARRKSLHAKPHTILGLRQGILTIASALKRRPPRDETVKAWEASLLCYITAASYSERTKHSTFSKSTQVYAEVARFRREVYRRAINPFSKKSTTGTPYVEPQVLERALSIARREALSVVQRFKNPPAEYKPFLAGLRDLANSGVLPSLCTHLERRPKLSTNAQRLPESTAERDIWTGLATPGAPYSPRFACRSLSFCFTRSQQTWSPCLICDATR